MKLTYRQLAARFAEALAPGSLPADSERLSAAGSNGQTGPSSFAEAGKKPSVGDLATATVQLAHEAGLTDTAALIAAIEQELLSHYGAAEVQVATAHKLSATQVAELSDSIAKVIGARQVSTVTSEDPDLIGGFEATAAGYAVHGSIQSSLKTVGAQHG